MIDQNVYIEMSRNFYAKTYLYRRLFWSNFDLEFLMVSQV